MEKMKVLFIFKTKLESKLYFEENYGPILSYKKLSQFRYETDNIVFEFSSYYNPDNLRGLMVDIIIMDTEMPYSIYNEIVKYIVKDRNKIIQIDRGW